MPNNINKKLRKVAGAINASDEQFKQLSNLADKYKNKSQGEIEEEMKRLIGGFSIAEKNNLIKKLQMLKQMTELLDTAQRRKIDMFIKLLSK
ncbi:hypothetical protein FQB35_10130 [Crassaminicella thermophila]|uniref:Uncharacterized protein n=1 Tax=Crassaminicella thermophila TaxID=2599308 RepID=A0A5C0SG22_CRATE|nr:hypothetical protein [Crassaminicella thermophila]QEK12657.1 hypothetical protein FQB35_10130 [Crassaminicella thermophila]